MASHTGSLNRVIRQADVSTADVAVKHTLLAKYKLNCCVDSIAMDGFFYMF